MGEAPVIDQVQCLISLPPKSTEWFVKTARARARGMFAASDPVGRKLGSSGGAALMLAEGWRATGGTQTLQEWLAASRKLVILGGGQSRRLPAYAPAGKPLIPMPVLQGTWGQRLDQTLLDLQYETYRRVLARADASARVMIASGDVMLRFSEELEPAGDVDFLMLGMRVDPETASHFGVFFMPRTAPETFEFMLQKPTPAKIRELARDYQFVVDTGMWLLGMRAVEALLGRCGWDAAHDEFEGGAPKTVELYSEMGLAMGTEPTIDDGELKEMRCKVQVLEEPQFYHLGTSRQMIESVCELQNRQARNFLGGAGRTYFNQVIQNAEYEAPADRQAQRTLWIENATVPATWKLAHDHLFTGVPENDWDLTLEPGVCLDFVPVNAGEICLRAYGIDDAFSGSLGDPSTLWFGREAREWFAARGIGFEEAGVERVTDIYKCALFPVVRQELLGPRLIEWLFQAEPPKVAEFAEFWLGLPRLSAEEINSRANLERLDEQRAAHRRRSLMKLYVHRRSNVFFRTDLESSAAVFAEGNDALPEAPGVAIEPMDRIHDHMWRAAVLRHRVEEGAEDEEARAFETLKESILASVIAEPPRPRCDVQADQIVWARSPARLDLAGGWTDTPPYCLMHGGRVTNAAVNLNGQAPIQVFAKLSTRPEIVLRSIDLGIEQRIKSHEDLATYDLQGSAFTLAKAALTIAGFLPRFYRSGDGESLEQQLKRFGGGIELSLVAAIPQGSGLGTSSIMAATLLGALNGLCALGWDSEKIIANTLAVEQMLTTGGGWQDQAGGVLRGIKHCRTAPGIKQTVTARWLPEALINDASARGMMMLFYTGITRMAKNILQEIVRGMFLNSAGRLAILSDIGSNADFVADAIQRQDWDGLCEGVRRNWDLNRRLDAGTNPPAIQAILEKVEDHLCAVKLSGAGGGGYMLMLAKDDAAAARIRQILTASPPNAKSRFVDFSISPVGMEVTRS